MAYGHAKAYLGGRLEMRVLSAKVLYICCLTLYSHSISVFYVQSCRCYCSCI